MGLTIATLQQHITDRRIKAMNIEQVELGKGFIIEAEKAVLVLFHKDTPEDKAACGFVDAQHEGRWTLDREWYVEIVETFGQIPENMAVEGDAV